MRFLRKLISYSILGVLSTMPSLTYATEPYYNISNVEGYVSLEENGITKYFIVVSNGNGIQLIHIKENPKGILKSANQIINYVNKSIPRLTALPSLKGGVKNGK